MVIYLGHFPFKYYNLLSKLQTESTENDTEHHQRSKMLTAEMPEGNLKELDYRPGGTSKIKQGTCQFYGNELTPSPSILGTNIKPTFH